MDIAKRKPSDFIKPGDYVIFPADDRGIRMIKIVPNVDSEFILAYWLRMGAELFAGEVPKSGYVFEKIAENWAPEEIDDKNWEPKPMSRVPQKVKTLEEAMLNGDYGIGLYRISCTRCGLEREAHARSSGRKTTHFEEQFCSRCEVRTLHTCRKIESVDVMVPAPASNMRYITHHEEGPVKNLHVYDWRQITWITKLRAKIVSFSQWVSRVLAKIRGLVSRDSRS